MYQEDASVAQAFNAASGSFAYTVNANGERFFVARFELRTPGVSVATATYNAVALTFIGRISNPSGTAVEFWGLKNPASGSNTFAWTLSASDKHVAAATGLSGINQTVPYRNFTAATGFSTAPALTLTGGTVEHKVMDALAVVEHATPLVVTQGANQTKQYEARSTGGAASSNVVGAGSVEDGAASVNMDWTLSQIRQWSLAAIEILPVVEGEIDITAVCVMTPYGSAIFAGKGTWNAQGLMSINGQAVRLGRINIAAKAGFECLPEFLEGNAYLPIAVPQVLFYFSDEHEFLMRWVLQELNRPKRVGLGGYQRVVLCVDGFSDKECTIEKPTGDGLARYITSPSEFGPGIYKAHLAMWLLTTYETEQPPEAEDEDAGQIVQVDSPEFLIIVKEPAV